VHLESNIKQQRSTELSKRQDFVCEDTGAHMCALVAVGSTYGTIFGIGGSSVVQIFNSYCDNIVSSTPDSGSFNGDYELIFGTTLSFHADSIGEADISGISFTYQGNTFDQSGCFSRTVGGSTFVDSLVQCNFPC